MTLSVWFETKEDATVCGSCLVNTGREESCVYKMHRSWCQFYSGTVTLNQEIRGWTDPDPDCLRKCVVEGKDVYMCNYSCSGIGYDAWKKCLDDCVKKGNDEAKCTEPLQQCFKCNFGLCNQDQSLTPAKTVVAVS